MHPINGVHIDTLRTELLYTLSICETGDFLTKDKAKRSFYVYV